MLLDVVLFPAFPRFGEKKLYAFNLSPICAGAIVLVRCKSAPICRCIPTGSAVVAANTCEGKTTAFPIDPI